MGKSKSITIGYKYFLGIHFVLCHGEIDALTHIRVDDREAWTGSISSGQGYINAPELFGGEKKEGGIQGFFDVLSGSTSQGQNAYLASKIGSDVPNYRGVCSVVLNQMFLGNLPYLKKWGFRLRRITKRSDGNPQWYLAKATIGQDMNPAHIIYECLTDNDWGMGYLSSDIDAASFTIAADTLFNESFGMSILWENSTDIQNFLKDILRHIDAALYVDRTTGTFVLKLIREDYVAANLVVFNEDSIVKISDYACSTTVELANSVTVNFWDSTTGNTGSMTIQDTAMVQLQGATISVTSQYGGITKGELAARIASRDLRALSTPMMRCTIHANRLGASVKPGEAVKLTWPDYNVSDAIMRVAMIDFGSATDGIVKISLVQDVFSLGSATYSPPPATEWVPISTPPQPVSSRVVIEAPYYSLTSLLGEDIVDAKLANQPAAAAVFASGGKPSGDSYGFDLMIDSGAGYQDSGSGDFCAYAVTGETVSHLQTVVALSAVYDFYPDVITVNEYAFINNEIVEIVSYTQSSITIKRGCLDSVPSTHALGSKIYLAASLNAISQMDFVAGESPDAKLITRTSQGNLTLSSAPTVDVPMNYRALRPYPPGAFAISGSYFPSLVLDVPLTASWAHRNRLLQTGTNIVDFTEGSVTPETNTTYEIRLYNQTTSALLYTVSGLTGTSHSGFPTFSGNYQLRMELWSVRDTYASLFKHSHIFTYENIYRLTLEDGSGHIMTEDNNTLTTE